MLQWLKRLYAPPIFDNDEDRTTLARYLTPILWSALGLSVIGTLLFFFAYPSTRNKIIPYGIISTLGIIFAMRLMKHGDVKKASISFIAQVWLIIFALQIQSGQPISSYINIYPALILMSALLLSSRAAIFVTLLSILTDFGLLLAARSGILPSSVPFLPDLWEKGINTSVNIFTATLAILSVRALQGARNRAHQEKTFNEAVLNTQNALIVVLDREGRIDVFPIAPLNCFLVIQPMKYWANQWLKP